MLCSCKNRPGMPLSKRAYCPNCAYPVTVCLCHTIRPQANRTNVWILQHPSEAGVAKNTAHLVGLGLTACNIVVGERPADFSPLINAIKATPEGWALLYPGDKSTALEACPNKAAIGNLVVLDGTWKKAYKLFMLNPWLSAIPQLHFDAPPKGRYRIRKTRVADGLSTLEAVAWGLKLIEGANPEPLWALLEARMAHLSPAK